MDVHMPGMDGLAATRALRSQSAPLGQVKIVALTADAMSMTREQVQAAGMDDLLTKPFRAEALALLLAGAAQPVSPTPAPEPVPDLLDADSVRELLGLLSPTGYAPLLQAFFDDQAAFQQLEALLRTGKPGDELKRAAHRMKGAAQVLGLRGMAELTLGFEGLAQHLTPELGARAAEQLDQTCQASRAQCRAQGLIP
jgi:CheY-like chemotaxis protein